jgi:catechol 2,3-dioxygenase-like lactoylglutathione lyase family enzyme
MKNDVSAHGSPITPIAVRLVGAVLAMLCVSTPSFAQGRNTATPLLYGHHHLNVTSIAAHLRFWADTLGGIPVKIGETDNVKFPGVIVRLRSQAPTGGILDTTVDHVAFEVADIGKVLAKVKSAGYAIAKDTEATVILAPDNVRVELVENKKLRLPIAMDHVHLATTATSEMVAWYANTFGGNTVRYRRTEALRFADFSLQWRRTDQTPASTRGRALDHIGFEIANLERFCARLEAQGIKFDRPYSTVPDLGIGNAFLTDPWGTHIELTEGLRSLVE